MRLECWKKKNISGLKLSKNENIVRRSLRNCLFAITRPLKNEVDRSVGEQCSIFTQYLFQNYPKQWRKNYIILLYGCSLIGFACPAEQDSILTITVCTLTTFYLNLVGYKMCALLLLVLSKINKSACLVITSKTQNFVLGSA